MKKLTKSAERALDKFASATELLAMGLNGSSCQLDRGAYMDLRTRKQAQAPRIVISSEVTDVAPSHFDALVRYSLAVQDSQGKSRPLTIECVFGTHFHGPQPVDKRLAEQFVNSFARILLWPFFRQFVFDTTARMAIPPITLPLLPES